MTQPAEAAEAYLERYRFQGDPADLHAAAAVIRRALRAERDPRARAALLRQRAAGHQERYLAGAGRSALRRAVGDYEQALNLLSRADPLRPAVLTELGTVLQDRFTETGEEADLNRAVALGRRATTADPDGPDAPFHWVNLGTALFVRYEHAGRIRDLDTALRSWIRAAALLPDTSPYRAAFHDRLTIGFWSRWESGTGSENDLADAVEHGRHAVRLDADVLYAGHLSGALLERWHAVQGLDDLNEAVAVYAAAIGTLDEGRARAPELLTNFAETLVTRYQEIGNSDDLDLAITTLRRARRGTAGQDGLTALRSATARALAMRYQARGAVRDLTDGITEAGRAVAATPPDNRTYASRTARLSWLLFLRYCRSGRRADLDAAIRGLTELPAGRASGTQLHQLAGYFAERHAYDGSPADLAASLHYARQAALSHEDIESSVLAGLASAVHDEFSAGGRFDDLDESITRHRAALDATRPQAPAHAAMLNNLAVALRHRHIYSDDDAALNEAIALHEHALDAAGPGSPERAGYLDALGGAVQLRYERDRDPADLHRAITLTQDALRALPARSPERPVILAGLAAVLRLRGDVDEAIAAYRSALRTMGRSRGALAMVRHDYADALAEAGTTTAAGRAFRLAAQEADTPIARLDVTAGWGAWALRTRRWDQAATALAAAATARRDLLGAQHSRTHRERWLTRASEIAVGEAYAAMQLHRTSHAVTALDAGRALILSEELESRAVAGRLRATGHTGLADRYEQAAHRFAELAATRRTARARLPPAR